MALNRAITLSSYEREQKGIAKGQSMQKRNTPSQLKLQNLL